MKDILNAVNKTMRALVKQYPGVSTEAVAGAVDEMVKLALESPKGDLDDLTLAFDMAVEAGEEEWSAELSDILLEKVVRPEFDKAVDAGVDPVTVIRANCGMTEAKARSVVAKLTAPSFAASTPEETRVLMGDGSIAEKADEPETAQV